MFNYSFLHLNTFGLNTLDAPTYIAAAVKISDAIFDVACWFGKVGIPGSVTRRRRKGKDKRERKSVGTPWGGIISVRLDKVRLGLVMICYG